MRSFLTRYGLKAAAAGALLALLTWYYVHFYSFAFSVNSDNAYFLLAGEDMLSGNLLLANWRGGFFTGLTGDILATALLRTFLSRKAVLYLTGPLTYALIAGLSLLLMTPSTGKRNLPIRLACLLPILFVPTALRHPLLTVGMHGIAVVYILLLFFLTEKALSSNRGGDRWLRLGLLSFIAAAGVIADTFVLYYGVLPLLAVLILRQFRQRTGNEIKLIFLLGIAAVIGKAVPAWLNQAGFLQTGAAQTTLTPLSHLPAYLLNTLLTWLRIFGFILSELNGPLLRAIPQIAGAVAALMILAALLRTLLQFFRADRLTQVLLAACAFCAGSFTFTTVTREEQAVRYLSPAFFFGLILFARQLTERPLNQPKIQAMFCLPLLLFSLGNVRTTYLSGPQNNQAFIEIGEALLERGLQNGYGTYWESHAINYYSDNRISVAPVETANDVAIPSAQATKMDWYKAGFNAEFLLVSRNKTYGLTEPVVRAAFGPYDEYLLFNETDIYIYHRNISQEFEK